MAAPESFEDLDAWKAARELTIVVCGFCRCEAWSRDFGLTHQLRRAAVSVMNNIAEGWESISIGEKRQAYGYARRSCGEVRSMSYVLLDNHFTSAQGQSSFLCRCIRPGKLISGWIRSLNKRD